jgi:hypothetical protein
MPAFCDLLDAPEGQGLGCAGDLFMQKKSGSYPDGLCAPCFPMLSFSVL